MSAKNCLLNPMSLPPPPSIIEIFRVSPPLACGSLGIPAIKYFSNSNTGKLRVWVQIIVVIYA